MVRVALTAGCCLTALLLAGISALAQDVAAQPAYPISTEQPAPKAKHHVRRKVVRHHAAAPVPQPRAMRAKTKRETVAKAMPLPAPKQRLVPPGRPVPLPEPKPQQQAALQKDTALPPKETAPPAPPITLGGRNEWRIVTDAATGAVIGVPGRLLTDIRDTAHGTLWSSPHGEIQLETFRYAEPGLTLGKLFDRVKREPAGRKIGSSKLNDDNFAVSGMQGLRYFFVRAWAENGELRGYTLLFDQAMEGIVDPLIPAIAKAFIAFPERAPASAPPSKIVRYGSGILVSRQGHILTSAGMTEGCDALLANGIDPAERVAAGNGLALLRASGVEKLTPIAIASAENPGTLTLAGVPDPREQKGGAATRYLKARLAGAAIELVRPKPLAGFAGAAALDAQGRLAGLIDPGGVHLASAGPPSLLHFVDIKAIRAFLSAHGVDVDAQPGEPRSGILRVVCVRK